MKVLLVVTGYDPSSHAVSMLLMEVLAKMLRKQIASHGVLLFHCTFPNTQKRLRVVSYIDVINLGLRV